MRKFNIKICLLLISLVCINPTKADAFFFPVGPVFDPLNIAQEALKTVRTASSTFFSVKETINNQIYSVKVALGEGIVSVLGGKEKFGAIPGAKEIAETQYVDYSDEADVKAKIEDLFWTYPLADNPAEQSAQELAYETKATQFYQENIVEVWAAVRGIDQKFIEFKAENEKRIEELRETTSSSSGEDKNLGTKESYEKILEAYEVYNALYTLVEELTAMKVQLIMSKAIKHDVKPKNRQNTTTSSLLKYSTKVGFASQELFVKAPSITDSTAPFSGSKEQVAELAKFNPAYKVLEEAVDYHNMLQVLPTYKNIFKRYEDMQKMHQKAKEMLLLSDNCTITFLSRYYKDPKDLWYGPDFSITDITDYDKRQGLSGWAYDLFSLAKQKTLEETEAEYQDGEQSKPLTSVKEISLSDGSKVSQQQEEELKTDTSEKYGAYEDLAFKMPNREVTGDIVTTQSPEAMSDLSTKDKEDKNLQETVSKDKNAGFNSDEDKKAAEEETRLSSKLYWDTGSETIRELLDNPQSFGSPQKIKDYPVWYDQQTFYLQYLNKKYDNIKSYLTSQSVLDAVFKKGMTLIDANRKDYDEEVTNLINENKAIPTQFLKDQAISKALQDNLKEYTQSVSSFSSALKNAFEDEIPQIINDYKEDLSKLERQDFAAANYQNFVDGHIKTMNKIAQIDIGLKNIADTKKTFLILNVLSEVLTNFNITTSNYKTADTDYFVGSPAKKRDLMAPAIIPGAELPNPREVFYFDDINWYNAGAENFNKSKFLDHEGYVPTIWKIMLKDKAFVETDFDIEDALKKASTAELQMGLIRGGKYPCTLGNTVVDLYDVGSVIYALFNNIEDKSTFQPCVFEEKIEGNYVINKFGKIYALRYNQPKAPSNFSELGAFLKDDKNLTSQANNLFKRMYEQRENTEATDEETKQTFTTHIEESMAYKSNQIGDFLRAAEEEIELKKIVEELKAQIEDIKWGEIDEITQQRKGDGLYNKLQAAGFTPPTTFSLANDADYNNTFNKLDDVKFAKYTQAKTYLDDVNIINNELAEQRKEDYENLIYSLQTDKEGYLVLDVANIASEESFLSMLEAEKTNREVNSKFQENVDKQAQEDIDEFQKPYCAAY